jgi:hypothetical protein
MEGIYASPGIREQANKMCIGQNELVMSLLKRILAYDSL